MLRAAEAERSAPVARSAAAEPAATLPSVAGGGAGLRLRRGVRRGSVAGRGRRGRSADRTAVAEVCGSVASGTDSNDSGDDTGDNDSNAFSDSDDEPAGVASLGDEGSPHHNQDDVPGTPGERPLWSNTHNKQHGPNTDVVAGSGCVLDSPVRANCQLLRSVSRWSAGSKVETSIHAAYCQNIKQARRWIYIENQFFVSGQSHDPQLGNRVAAALAARIIRAHKAGEPFRVMVVMPLLPCFEGELASGACPSLIPVVYWQMYSICRWVPSTPFCLRCYVSRTCWLTPQGQGLAVRQAQGRGHPRPNQVGPPHALVTVARVVRALTRHGASQVHHVL